MKQFFLLAILCLSLGASAQNRAADPPIFEAAKSGSLEKLQPFAQDAAQIKAVDNAGDTPLHKVLSNNNASRNELGEMAKWLIEKGADIKASNNFGLTPLHLAARSSNSESAKIVALLLEKGADPKARDARGSTPLHGVAKPDSAKLLIEKGADPNAQNDLGQTPLHVAVSYQAEPVAALLAGGADANKRDFNGDLPIHLALRGQYRRAAPELIAKSDLAARDSQGLTALQAILLSGNAEMREAALAKKPAMDEITQVFEAVARDDVAGLQKLIEAKPYLAYARLANGQTPLHLAARSLATASIEFLLAKKADPNARDAQANTPLHAAFVSRDKQKLAVQRQDVALLLQNGADVNAINGKGSAPLHLAFWIADKEFFALLLEKGADPNLRDWRLATPLHLAVMESEAREVALDFAEMLLQKGADLNALSQVESGSSYSGGYTPLALAVLRANSYAEPATKLATFFLQKGADFSLRDDAGNTVLHLAAGSAKKELLAQLLAAPAKNNVASALATRNAKGLTPLGYAISAKREEAAELLRQAGGKE